MALTFKSFASQNWIVTPVALATNESKPKSIADQKWFIILTGIGMTDLQGNSINGWRYETVHILPDLNAPLQFGISKYKVPKPAGGPTHPALDLDQWASFAALSSVFNRSISVTDAGFAVDSWRHHSLIDTVDASGKPAHRVFTGIDVNVAVRNSSSTLLRISYNISITGRIVFLSGVTP